jgi:hypothetical protein
MDDDERDDVISLAVAGTPERPPLPGLLLVIDEIDRICTPHNIPDGLRRVINYGRHYGVSVLAACRRPRAMHRDVTANADRIVIGQTQEPGDLDYLREFIGENLARRAARLARFECVTWPEDLEGGDAVDTGGTGVAQGTGAPTGEPEAEGPGVGMAGVRDAPSAPPGDSADDGGAGLSGGAQSPPGSAGRS